MLSLFKLALDMGTTVEVLFNKTNKSFSAGDIVLGLVVVESDKEANLRLIKALRVRCKGISTIDLKLGKDTEDNPNPSASIIYFINEDAKLYTERLVKTTYNNDKGLQRIKYEYPFRYELAKNIPSSFKTIYGRMEYSFKATLPSGVAKTYFEGRGLFSVIGACDLNKIPAAIKPIELKEEAKIGFLWFESGAVSFHISLPKSGFAIGEKIRLNQEIVNGCSASLTGQTTLVQKIQYDLKHFIRLEKENKIQVFGREIPAGVTDICNEEVFEVPIVPVSSDIKLKEDFKTVKISYFLKYEVHNNRIGHSTAFKGEIPIFIGSIPIADKISVIK